MKLKAERFSFLLLIMLPVFAFSQGVGDVTRVDAAGRNNVTGVVFAPSGLPVGRGIVVRISKAGLSADAYTDDQGRFKFVGLTPGSYMISVEPGGEFEPLTQQVDLDSPRGGLTTTDVIQLQLRSRSVNRPKPGVVDAANAGSPERALKHYRKAAEAAAKDDTKGAIEKLLQAVAAYPDFLAAHTELGIQYQKINELEKADEHLRMALKIKPDSYEALANRGIVFVRLGKYAEAETFLRDALKQKDDLPVIHYYLGRSFLGQKRPLEAEPEFKIAYEKGGDRMIEAKRGLASIYLDKGENEKAMVELEAYLTANPSATDAKELRVTIGQIKEWLKAQKKP